MQTDVIVLGAGIVGVSTALNLQRRGRAVVLLDRDAPGRGTSYGNAGVIQRDAILPFSFPQDLRTILGCALNNRRDLHYHFAALLKAAPALFRFWRNGRPGAVTKTALANMPLYELCLPEHEALAEAAGVSLSLRRNGWIKAFRSPKTRDESLAEQEQAATFGVDATVLDREAITILEPDLSDAVIGGLHYGSAYSIANPLGLTEAYAALFKKRGGRNLVGDARTLRQDTDGSWAVTTGQGTLKAPYAVLALGSWSDEVFRPLGYRVPFFVKRGYHLHFQPAKNAVLNHPVLDVDGGYVLAPMTQGIRVTSGVEIANRDSPPTPVQMERVEPWARELFPLGERVEKEPWMGCRPCLPDMLPVIGEAPAHKGLFFAFGHAHHGLTLAGSTGRLIAELVTGEAPFTDPSPYRIDRF